jgi:hypothetical protein
LLADEGTKVTPSGLGRGGNSSGIFFPAGVVSESAVGKGSDCEGVGIGIDGVDCLDEDASLVMAWLDGGGEVY